MMELQKEMTKAGIMEEMMEDTMAMDSDEVCVLSAADCLCDWSPGAMAAIHYVQYVRVGKLCCKCTPEG